jgi:hypothetical protein
MPTGFYSVVEPTELNTPLQVGEEQLLVICCNLKLTGGSTTKGVRVKADAAEICEATERLVLGITDQ